MGWRLVRRWCNNWRVLRSDEDADDDGDDDGGGGGWKIFFWAEKNRFFLALPPFFSPNTFFAKMTVIIPSLMGARRV